MTDNPFTLPPPGVQGDWRGTCVVCMRGTDSGLAFRGEAEFIIACHMHLGIPQDQATTMVEMATGCDPGNVPDGVITLYCRVCAACAAKAGAPAPGLLGVGLHVPCVDQQHRRP